MYTEFGNLCKMQRRSRRLQESLDRLKRIEQNNDAWAIEVETVLGRPTCAMTSNAALSGVPKTEPRGPTDAERAGLGYGTISPLELPGPVSILDHATVLHIDPVPTPNPNAASRARRCSCCCKPFTSLDEVDVVVLYALIALGVLALVGGLVAQIVLAILKIQGILHLSPLQVAMPFLAMLLLAIFGLFQWCGLALWAMVMWGGDAGQDPERHVTAACLGVCAWPTLIPMGIYWYFIRPVIGCLCNMR